MGHFRGTGALAMTVDTFSFTQGGYVDQLQSNVLTNGYGSFAGTPDASGFISLTSLTGFTFLAQAVTPTFFSFDVNGGSSSLDAAFSFGGGPNTEIASSAPPRRSAGILPGGGGP